MGGGFDLGRDIDGWNHLGKENRRVEKSVEPPLLLSPTLETDNIGREEENTQNLINLKEAQLEVLGQSDSHAGPVEHHNTILAGPSTGVNTVLGPSEDSPTGVEKPV